MTGSTVVLAQTRVIQSACLACLFLLELLRFLRYFDAQTAAVL